MSRVSDPRFTLVQLRYFATAAELKSMTAAARQLMVSQSAVSTAVSQLEKDLQVQLLLRHHARGLSLTAAGEAFYRELRSFLAHGTELAEAARNTGANLTGGLNVGCFSTLAPFRLPRLLTVFEEAHPNVRVGVVEAEHASLKQSLRSGGCEVALMYGYDLGAEFDSVVVDVAAPYAIVASNHRLAKRKRVELTELASEPMVLLDLPHSGTYFEGLVAATGRPLNVRHRSTGYETVRSLVAHGLGYALLNQRPPHADTYAGRKVVALNLKDAIQPLEIVVTWMSGARLTRRAQAFVSMVRKEYRTPRGGTPPRR